MEKIQPVMVTINDHEFDMHKQSSEAKLHYMQVVSLRQEIDKLTRQIENLQASLSFREQALAENIKNEVLVE